MIWKVLVLTFKQIQTSASPLTYRTADDRKIDRAHEGLQRFATGYAPPTTPPSPLAPAVAGRYTDGNLGFNLLFSTVEKLVPKSAYQPGVWLPMPGEIPEIMAAIPWGAYDAIWVVAPFEHSPHAHYDPATARGATYAMFPVDEDLLVCDNHTVTHEFLHGAARFFQLMGYRMPRYADATKDSGDGMHMGDLLYPHLSKQCWGEFYEDVMRGTARPHEQASLAPDEKTWVAGVKLDAWNLGSPRNLGAFVGRRIDFSLDSQGREVVTPTEEPSFRAVYGELGQAFPVEREGRRDGQMYAVDGGWQQNFGSAAGDCGILKQHGNAAAFAVRPGLWDAFRAGGGVAGMGFPASALYEQSGVKVQDFRKGTTASAVLQGPGQSAIAVKPAIWTAFVAAGGVGVVGHPTSELHGWGDGNLQDFTGPTGGSAIMQGNGRGAFWVKPALWPVFVNAGGAPSLGYPTNDLHPWGDGNLQDFTGPSGSSAIMQGTGRGAFLVKPAIWGAFVGAGGAPSLGYPTNDLHPWGEGNLQDFTGPSGGSAVMQGNGRGAFPVLPVVWRAYTGEGGAPSLGYPTNALHRWGAGYAQDFELASGWHSGGMQADGRADAFFVKGLIWKHYVAVGGATSYLGYPVTAEYQTTVGGVGYYMQTFQGGKIRINRSTGAAQDYR